MDISSSSALVTGGTSGLGLATALRLAKDGARVVVMDLPGQDGGPRKPIPAELTFSGGDVTSEADVTRAIETAVALAPLRVVANCAGVLLPRKLLGRKGAHPLEQFMTVVTVNLGGTFNVIRLAAAAMVGTEPVNGDRGVIVCTSSIAAFEGQIGQISYAASKAAIAGMTLPLARELAEHCIRVVTIAPGTFATPMLTSLPQETQDSLADQVPHPKRLGTPEEYAALVAHIIDNGMLNGEVIRLDGAIRMGPS